MKKLSLEDYAMKVKSFSNQKMDFYDNVKDAKKWVDHYYKEKQKKHLFDDLKRALIQYTEGFYKIINPFLRKTQGKIKDPDILKFFGFNSLVTKNTINKIEKIDKAFKNLNLDHSICVYRRTSKSHFSQDFGTLRTGKMINEQVVSKIIQFYSRHEHQVYKEYAYLSTSLTKDPSPNYDSDKLPVLLKIKVPKGTQAIFLDDISTNHGEMEVLINRGYRFKYERFSIIKDNTYESLQIDVSLIK